VKEARVPSHSADEEPLEPLPVVVDGVELPPVPTADPAERYALPDAREVAEAVRATIAEAPALLAYPPWSLERGSSVPVPPRPARYVAGFSRMIPLPGSRLETLAEWWQRRAQRDRVAVSRWLVLEEPRRDDTGVWRIRARLRTRARARAIPVELLLWPRFDAWTRLSVEPQRGVHVSRRYFARGHRVLDAFCEELRRNLDAAALV
jgi:hypothetical protein